MFLVLSQTTFFAVSDTERMKTTKPLFVRPVTESERQTLEDSLRAPDAFVLRRAQIILATLARMGVRWRRAKEWITSPDPEYARKKARRDRLIRLAQRHPDWLLGFEDEVWWSRLAHPALHAWQDDDYPLHLMEQTVARDDPDPKAVACYGLLARWWETSGQRTEELW